MLEKIISGGQTGADIGGLRAAVIDGLKTGGWMPKGWLTEDGPKVEYATLYGMKEISSWSYSVRTRANVCDSDGTLIFNVGRTQSSGTKCAIAASIQFEKSVLANGIIRGDDGLFEPLSYWPSDVALWIKMRNIKVLNCAGNRESKAPGIAAFVEQFMAAVIEELKGSK